ncbi:gasdermin-D isoform X1 [Vulpes lagopus]|uniref:gasdermin-D isoform X1 n=1 Tax=Vulpes lagopus TaxID=494514 RepID=UPI001BCA08EC|nr:gasdermin-D isoform X1 [Vulpes lagopus]XP_041625604.1 gasdermin-D isoform X1 [Vulpes lagopus]XP_041625605.1 gasdermin-D isoform X1 [Vulpes lagopus]XP_041625606.1 gasdermin-D isoform X1 [Vulpes lagopus]XP_041625607.1 gasdermin-D isoform X1 [Vulpes lagopus]XP_041625608.1 gasdermin-D isoform X1 [Vulpes lagopus]XP_041625609.1 gasdermin-D isoform X1 [Vulpes lagopus]XP_041625610.1 gasdermin-D isoform X1 [Vulpes lagopus]
MGSAFEGVIKSVIRELDHRGKLIPVDSLRSSTSFQPYCLLARKLSRLWFWKPRYKCINLSIRDILEPNDPEPGTQPGGKGVSWPACCPRWASGFLPSRPSAQLQGSVELAPPGQVQLAGEATVADNLSTSMNVCTLRVVPNTWDTMRQERRLRQPQHKILEQLRNCGNDIFVVTEVLQTQKEVTVTWIYKQEGSGQFSLPGALSLQGQGHLRRKKTVTIPSGSILAFEVAQLVIGPDWDVLFFPNKKQRTFKQSKKDRKPMSSASSKIQSDGFGEDSVAVTEDFQGLLAEVGTQAERLRGLSRGLCDQLLAGLVRVLQEESALQTLEEALEQGLFCGWVAPLEGPVGAVLECLVHTSRALEEQLARPVLYLVDLLTGLNETQLKLLTKVLETRELSRPFKLVQSILEQSTPWQERRAVSLPQGLLDGSWDAEAPAWLLLEECGLELQVDDPQVCWEPGARDHTCTLYACLALLLCLSEDPC